MNEIVKISEKIRERCVGCAHGYEQYAYVQCKHWLHPGYVGGYGTEWALTCAHYEPDGKKGRIEIHLIRE